MGKGDRHHFLSSNEDGSKGEVLVDGLPSHRDVPLRLATGELPRAMDADMEL
jgi:hypothetical protein